MKGVLIMLMLDNLQESTQPKSQNLDINKIFKFSESNVRLFKIEDGKFALTESDVLGVSNFYDIEYEAALEKIVESHNIKAEQIYCLITEYSFYHGKDQIQKKIQFYEKMKSEAEKEGNTERAEMLQCSIDRMKDDLRKAS